MRNKITTLFLATTLLLIASTAQANWRSHMTACGNNKQCAYNEAAAKKIFKENYSSNVQKQCGKQWLSSNYIRNHNYQRAVSCANNLQRAENQANLERSQLANDRAYREYMEEATKDRRRYNRRNK